MDRCLPSRTVKYSEDIYVIWDKERKRGGGGAGKRKAEGGELESEEER